MLYYHMRISGKLFSGTAIDLTEQQLRDRFVRPYKEGTPIALDGRIIAPDDIDEIRILFSSTEATRFLSAAGVFYDKWAAAQRAAMMTPTLDPPWFATDVTNRFIIGPPGNVGDTQRGIEEIEAEDSKTVFVVHGRNSKAGGAMFAFLRSIGLHPIEWSQALKHTGKPSPYVGEILDKAFSMARVVVVLMTPDDKAFLKQQFRKSDDPVYETELTGQARPNVLFEAGMAMGRYPDRTILVQLGSLRPFSDISGLHIIKIDNSTQKRQDLAERLQLAGCDVDMSGRDWHTAGDFELSEDDTEGITGVEQQVVTKLDTRKIQKLLERTENGEWDAVRLLFDYLEEGAKDNSAYEKYEESLKNWDDNELRSRVSLPSRKFDTSSLSSEDIKSFAYTFCKKNKDSRTLVGAFGNPKYSDFRRRISSYLQEILEDILDAS